MMLKNNKLWIHLSGELLIGSAGEQIPHHGFVILLGRHIKRSEAIQRLHVDIRAILDKDSHDDRLTRQRGDV